MLIEESIATSKAGSDQVQQVAEIMRSISESASGVRTLVDEVNVGSQEQARGVEEIGKAIAQMSLVTQNGASSAEEGASASEEMSAQAEALNQIVHQLRALVGRESADEHSPAVTA